MLEGTAAWNVPLYAIARSNHPNEVADFRNLLSNGPRFNSSTILNVNRNKNEAANERNWNEHADRVERISLAEKRNLLAIHDYRFSLFSPFTR